MAKEHGIRPVAATNAYFADPEDHELHRLLRAIAEGCFLEDVDDAHREGFLRNPAHLLDPYDPHAILSNRAMGRGG